MKSIPTDESKKRQAYQFAFGLAVFTVIYNIIEGFTSIYFGYSDESLTLFGFGIDSFIEVISGLGVAHMILRLRRQQYSPSDDFERTATRITGYSLYGLTFGLLATMLYNIWTGHKPETTIWGVFIAVISILVMWILILAKTRVGRQLNSEAILADAACAKVCIYMSIMLLISSAIYEWTAFKYADSIGTLGLSYFAFVEGRECFEN